MKVLVWNCRGLGSPSAVRALKEVIRSSSPQVVGLIETKADKRRCEVVRVKFGFDCCFVVPARGRSGGLSLLWNNNSDVSVVSYSGYHIDFILNYQGTVHMTLFYGNPKTNLRHHSWGLLRKLRELISLPWCVVGDFNEICSFSESTSRNLSRRGYIEQFREVLLDCGLVDLGFKGSEYTYSNKRQGREEVKCRLDRAVGDELWVSKFPNAALNHLQSHFSDHCPLLLNLTGQSVALKKMFRFESMWMRDASIVDTINNSWNANGTNANFGGKLSQLSRCLQVWNTKKFGNVNNKLKSLKEELAEVRQGERTHISAEKEKKISQNIDEWLAREECMWSQRSRVDWLCEGDNNTRFFHLKANARSKVNFISDLVDRAGRSHSNAADIEKLAISYFQDIFASTHNATNEEVMFSLECIPTAVTNAHNRLLMEPYLECEIKTALFQLYPFKSPGLDGFPAGFFQKFWTTIRSDFTAACFSILNEGIIPAGTNDTLIVLIPKQKAAKRMEEFRPISLTSVISKTVAKVIVNRLQQVLSDIISPAQSAFIKGRLITDNYLIAHEVSHFIKNLRQGKSVYGSLKLDMSKAYDRIEWGFLKLLLLRFGFEARWVTMIMNYVSSVRYAIRINGNVTDFFVPGRGLRQGDPLSPYLFILCSEWLSYSLSKLHFDRVIFGLRVNRRAPYITHIMFADDCLLTFKVEDSTAETLSTLLKQYEKISGQVINYSKSELVLSRNVTEETRLILQDVLSVKIVSHHDRYPGLPLSLKRKLTLNFTGVIDKIWNKTEGWISKQLSAGGKEILIKSVLQAVPQYAMNCFLLPEYVINKMHSAIRRFWWSCSASKKAIHWTKAKVLCQDKDMGGIGFKDLRCVNLAFLAKQAWRIHNQPDLLVSKIYKAKYFQSTDMMHCSLSYRPSFCWRSIFRGMDLIKAGMDQDQNGNLRWTVNESGHVDVSSAYKLSMRIHGRDRLEEADSSDHSQRRRFWKEFWKMSIPRKIKIFGWRGFHEALPTGSSLYKRGMQDNVGCTVCGYHIETYAHSFLHCWFARAVWHQLGIDVLTRLPQSVCFADILHYNWSQFGRRRQNLVLVALWLMWHNRNKLKHGEKGYMLNELVYKVISQTRSFVQHESKFLSSMRFLYSSDFVWKRPPVGFIKINCDASWSLNMGGGFGIVARDSDGTVLGVRAIQCADANNSAGCEGRGLLESFRMAEQINADKVVFELDCAEVVKWFNICPDVYTAREKWFKDSVQILQRHMDWKIFLIRREPNFVADQLAKLASRQNWFWTRLDCCPRIKCLSS